MKKSVYEPVGRVHVPLNEWGVDHIRTVMYAETCAVDNDGHLQPEKMRTNENIHPRLGVYSGKDHPTILAPRDGCQVEKFNHDDWSCLEDAQAMGLLLLTYRVGNDGQFHAGEVTLTPFGWQVAGRMRQLRSVMRTSEMTWDHIRGVDPNSVLEIAEYVKDTDITLSDVIYNHGLIGITADELRELLGVLVIECDYCGVWHDPDDITEEGICKLCARAIGDYDDECPDDDCDDDDWVYYDGCGDEGWVSLEGEFGDWTA